MQHFADPYGGLNAAIGDRLFSRSSSSLQNRRYFFRFSGERRRQAKGERGARVMREGRGAKKKDSRRGRGGLSPPPEVLEV